MKAGSSRCDAEAAFVRACMLDIEVMKPGNVSLESPGHGMSAEQFVASAMASAPAVCAAGAPIGRRILDAVEATLSAAGCNTNLGIVLLCAPIASAFEESGAGSSAVTLQLALRRRLERLTVADAKAAFRAIALANPGGLGTADDQDVHAEPTSTLRAAMALAQERDLIARQYANGYADLFEVGFGGWQETLAVKGRVHPEDRAHPQEHVHPGKRDREYAMQRTFLIFLSRFPDSHIVRKHGLEQAQAVSREARYWLPRVEADPLASLSGLKQWDDRLKASGINPGTSADLAVATAFIGELLVRRA